MYAAIKEQLSYTAITVHGWHCFTFVAQLNYPAYCVCACCLLHAACFSLLILAPLPAPLMSLLIAAALPLATHSARISDVAQSRPCAACVAGVFEHTHTCGCVSGWLSRRQWNNFCDCDKLKLQTRKHGNLKGGAGDGDGAGVASGVRGGVSAYKISCWIYNKRGCAISEYGISIIIYFQLQKQQQLQQNITCNYATSWILG